MISYTFLVTFIDFARKIIKFRWIPTLGCFTSKNLTYYFVVVTCLVSSLSSNQRFAKNVYSQAAHLVSGFSGGEIHDLRRLQARRRNPELTESSQLVKRISLPERCDARR